MSQHFLIKCSSCDVVITQCRCADPTKTVTYSTCDACKKLGKAVPVVVDQEEYRKRIGD